MSRNRQVRVEAPESDFSEGSAVRLPRAGAPVARRASGVLDGPFTEAKELVAAYWPPGSDGQRTAPPGRYARVNGLRMYYEVHGSGRPLVVLHASLETIDGSFGRVLPTLARTRQVIAIEQQAHGRTQDIARPLSYEQMADDTVELLRQLRIEAADFLGYSMGGMLALSIALRHPRRVRKLALVSSVFNREGLDPEFIQMLKHLNGAESADWSLESRRGFQRVGARPEQWSRALTRTQEALASYQGLHRDELRAIRAHTLIVAGARGVIHRDHSSELARLVPHAHFELFAGHDHEPAMLTHSAGFVPDFLDTPSPSAS